MTKKITHSPFHNTKIEKISQTYFNDHWIDFEEITFSDTFKDTVRVWDWTKFRKEYNISGRVRYWCRNHDVPIGAGLKGKNWKKQFESGDPVVIYLTVPDDEMPVPVAANELEPIPQGEAPVAAFFPNGDEDDDTDWKKSFYNLTEWVDGFIKEHTDLILELAEFKKNQSKETKTSP